MKLTNRQSESPIGLDVGTSRIVAAQGSGDNIEVASELNAFVSIPYSKLTVSVLEKEHVPHSVTNGRIDVHGNASERFAELMDVEIRRPMTRGVLDGKEPESLGIVREIVASLVGPAGQGRKLCFSVPAPPLGSEDGLTYHESTLRRLLGDLGYETKSINEGLAVIYAELESTNYTGIGVSCGGGLCNVAMAYLSTPVLSFSIPKAGDYIDFSAATVTGERANRIRLVKEDLFHFNGFHADKVQQVVSVYYDDMIESLVRGMKEAFSRSGNMPRNTRAVPLVLSGGTALPGGFRDRFENVLRAERNFPVEIAEVRMAANPLHSTAKGALISALSEM